MEEILEKAPAAVLREVTNLLTLGDKGPAATVSFILVCMLMGCLIVLLDWLLYRATGKSALKLVYGGGNTLRFFVFWGLGAGIGGYLGAATDILKLSLQGSIAAGVGWTLVLPRLMTSAKAEIEEEQPDSTEEKEVGDDDERL